MVNFDNLQDLMLGDETYQKDCEEFFRLAKDDDTIQKLKGILYDGKIGNYQVCSYLSSKENVDIERKRRISMANLLIQNPDVFDFFVSNHINVFHGTNANALPGILKYGLNSGREMVEQGQPILTGEEWSRYYGPRPFVSFTDNLEVAENYSTIPASKKADKKLSYGVVICTTASEVQRVGTVHIVSDFPEIGVKTNYPLESIKCICVPKDKVNFVRKMVGDMEIPVLGMDGLQQSYSKTQPFSFTDADTLARSRSSLSIKSLIAKVGEIFLGKEEREVGRIVR